MASREANPEVEARTAAQAVANRGKTGRTALQRSGFADASSGRCRVRRQARREAHVEPSPLVEDRALGGSAPSPNEEPENGQHETARR